MRTIRPILSQSTTNISQLRKNPSAIVARGDGFPVAVLSRNEPHFYCVPAELYEKIGNEPIEDIVDGLNMNRMREYDTARVYHLHWPVWAKGEQPELMFVKRV